MFVMLHLLWGLVNTRTSPAATILSVALPSTFSGYTLTQYSELASRAVSVACRMDPLVLLLGGVLLAGTRAVAAMAGPHRLFTTFLASAV